MNSSKSYNGSGIREIKLRSHDPPTDMNEKSHNSKAYLGQGYKEEDKNSRELKRIQDYISFLTSFKGKPIDNRGSEYESYRWCWD